MELGGQRCYLVGMKGTGMACLAVLLSRLGACVGGCDSDEVFSTDALLEREHLECDSGFHAELLPKDTTLVIHSSAYDCTQVGVLRSARARNLPVYSYPEFLSQLTRQQESWAVAGTHGKTTTCSVAAHLLHAYDGSFPFYALYGSSQTQTDEFPWYGAQMALFEACEYQDHFLSYRLKGVLVTSIEHDHPDWFSDTRAVMRSFMQLVLNLQTGGTLLYCADDPGAVELAAFARTNRSDLTVLGYGFAAEGPFRIEAADSHRYALALDPTCRFVVRAEAKALVDNHIGSLVLASNMLGCADIGSIAVHLATYTACTGRTEVLSEQDGVVYLDDYAHHPTEIATSIEEVRRRYPDFQVLVVFCPHTYSRTIAFLDGFVSSLSMADALVIQSTCVSARIDKAGDEDPAKLLAQRIGEKAVYAENDDQAVYQASQRLQRRWLCITMGAGNNRRLCEQIAQQRRSL